MIIRKFLFSAILILTVLCSPGALGQKVVSSDSSYILVQNNTIIISNNDFETKLPFAILFPMFNKKRTYVTNVSQINLIGKLRNPGEIKKLYLDDKEVVFSEEGLFFKIIDVSPGKNMLHIQVIPKSGKTLIVNFFILRPDEGS
ncbi:MAG: hypothetical protein J7K46_10630 [Bacteroidales bacterium]|nr:hypothetical protein [Bacteroidales bacterium]